MQAIFLDIETTGLDPSTHRVLEIAFKVVDLQTGAEAFTYQSIVKQPFEIWEKRDPGSIHVNGFTWERNLLGHEEEAVAKEIIQIFTDIEIERGKAFYICQNPAFDRTFFAQIVNVYTQEKLHWPYHWLDFASMYWALKVKEWREKSIPFPKEVNLSKNVIAEHYHLPIETTPHCALNGVNHLISCYKMVVGFLQ